MAKTKLVLGRVRPVYTGPWDETKAYGPLERATWNGAIYECLEQTEAGKTPDGGKWLKISDDLSTLVPKNGQRGSLAGCETAMAMANGQTIGINSPDCINLRTSGAVTLTFTPGNSLDRAVKALSITAEEQTALVVEGAVWQNNGDAPEWGSPNQTLVIIAHFVGGRVVLSVADNTEA